MLQGMSPENVLSGCTLKTMPSGKGQTQNGTYLYDSISVKYPERQMHGDRAQIGGARG